MKEEIIEAHYIPEFLSSKLNRFCLLIPAVPNFCLHCLQNYAPEKPHHGYQ